MQSIDFIKIRLQVAKGYQKEFAGCTPGTEGYERLQAANITVQVLEWVLKDK